MLDPTKEFIIDAVAHPYNHSPENYRDPEPAAMICEMAFGFNAGSPNPECVVPHDTYISDWSVEDTANVLFRESPNDLAVVHTLPFGGWFKDRYCSVEKSLEAVQRWPNRMRAYASVDPLQGKAALDELDRQVELLNPTGLKLYPTSWDIDAQRQIPFKMDDPKFAFPLYERAMELGIKVVAVHKSLPTGPLIDGDTSAVGDLEGAAGTFPDLAFEIVHGGLAFTEETAWLLGRFPNVYVNMEILNFVLERRPRMFSKILLGLMKVGGTAIYDRFIWATGCVVAHPRPGIEAFCEYLIPEDLLEEGGLFAPIEQISDDHKRNIFAGNWARLHGLDIEATKKAIADDEFSRARREDPNPQPWSTTSKWTQIEEERRKGSPTASAPDLPTVPAS
ncbi:hypothetical protein CBI38_32850 (plasmid) [Rhodococcus oxybenzonivorans]|uniref:Amidohydrolase-related domain-containing protein n=1 Tax=Rhodococcus oxybenzonivorans TaxID=1990687 RepID=A0A2S2C5W0_9NOCA|nr:amidohydrolase family protein [Rhodococcus oxybenzonivorans]AWK76260.1 hypothetical protein CBI38_32850 [Rhodococcus oxybenzonivorans]